MTDLSILERRRIEATVLKPVYEEMVARFGEAVAQEVLGSAVEKAAIAHARTLAEGETSLQTYADLIPLWQKDDALRIEVTRRDDAHFDFDVKRCRYAEMYREMGLGHIGHLLSCNRDGAFCTGYDPRLKLTRTQTIMQGASHCDFRYTYEAQPEE
ncbi:L-2-amino-thiazoline-4-carboxylic acid hydrolase [Azospirillum sp. A39]|uniref:L-2-amino-thiazoline-4-carboxylic acid hydrolase n=1 Tax=Azospirillum sp. A39 TaxID=3462279 RepID=UPI0040453E5E